MWLYFHIYLLLNSLSIYWSQNSHTSNEWRVWVSKWPGYGWEQAHEVDSQVPQHPFFYHFNASSSLYSNPKDTCLLFGRTAFCLMLFIAPWMITWKTGVSTIAPWILTSSCILQVKDNKHTVLDWTTCLQLSMCFLSEVLLCSLDLQRKVRHVW